MYRRWNFVALFCLVVIVGAGGCGDSSPGSADGGTADGGVDDPDTTVPNTGTGIVFSALTETGVTVSWGEASDDVTAAADLAYKLVVGASAAEMDTVAKANAIEGAGLLLDWSAATLTKDVTGLNAGTLYWFAVLVRDEAGNIALYLPASQFTVGWHQQAYLKAPNSDVEPSVAGRYARFGHSVAIWGDTVVVGARGENSNQTTITNGDTASSDNSSSESGAAYVFARNGTSWSQQAYLKAPNNDAYDWFGGSVAIAADTIVVGATGEDSDQTTITNGDTASSDNSKKSSGAAYVFTRSGAIWSQQAYLKASNSDAGHNFGGSVTIAEDTIVVGATGEASNQTTITNGDTASSDNSSLNAGAAYVFARNGTIWSQQAYLKAPNSAAHHWFGGSVAIAADTIVVGATGDASNQTTITNGDTASSDDSSPNAGAAYVFTRSGTTWSQQAYLKAPNSDAGDFFGWSVAISGDTVAVGAIGEASNQTTITNGDTASTNNSRPTAGAAYVFTRSGTTWSQQAYLKAPNNNSGNEFGGSVAISGDGIVVGALKDRSNQTTITNGDTASSNTSLTEAGAAYVIARSGAIWSQQAYLKPPNIESGDRFSTSVAIAGDTIVVGAPGEDSNQTTITNGPTASSDNSNRDSGAAYVFKYQAPF